MKGHPTINYDYFKKKHLPVPESRSIRKKFHDYYAK